MKAFTVRWRSAKQFREFELHAAESIGSSLLSALEASGGISVWQAGTLWKCPGCGDRTLRTEEFLEGLRLAEVYLHDEETWRRLAGEPNAAHRASALAWLENIAATMLGCERDRVYIKEEGGNCRFATETFISRI